MPQATKVSILGLGKSGFETALFLHQRGYELFVSEYVDSEQTQAYAQKLEAKGIRVELGYHSTEKLLMCDWAVFSPGIKPTTEIYQAFESKSIAIYSDIEVASWFSPAQRVLAVTGSCGKTTVTTLITAMIKAAGHQVVSCGNIGNPWISEIDRLTADSFVVLELSSFQLANCPSFRADDAILLNLSPNHLDWHIDFQDYVQSKLRLFINQGLPQRSYFRESDHQNYFSDLKLNSEVHFLNCDDTTLNPNYAVVKQIGLALGIDANVTDKVIQEFKGIEHRLEEVIVWKGITFINDSKSTTVASLQWALERSKDEQVVLIAGGIAKSKNFDELAETVRKKCKSVFLLGDATEMIMESWQSVENVIRCASLDEAIEKAIQNASEGDVVLFSPACASFDMFKNYEERGKIFKKKIHELTQG